MPTTAIGVSWTPKRGMPLGRRGIAGAARPRVRRDRGCGATAVVARPRWCPRGMRERPAPRREPASLAYAGQPLGVGVGDGVAVPPWA
jgi:hypothetical protein